MSRLFDSYLMVDWSANSKPKRGKDSIWAARAQSRSDGALGEIESWNWRTRHQAFEEILLRLEADGTERTLIGFDFPYGYPRGFARASGHRGDEPAWRYTWVHLASNIRDEPNNSNDRFAFASRMNLQLTGGAGPFWGRPWQHDLEHLGAKKPKAQPLGGTREEFRITENRLRRAKLSSIQSVWKLFYAGSVGSQALLGIPWLHKLRFHPDLSQRSKVWPFETGFGLDDEASIIHAEIWPGILKRNYAESGAVADEAQVRSLVRHLFDLDRSGRLVQEFAEPPDLSLEERERVLAEEGWILGASTL